MQAVEFLIAQHREIESLFKQYEASAGEVEAKKVFDRAEMAIINHAALEEMHVYPLLRKKLPGGDELADHAIEEHSEVERTLKQLEARDAGSPEFDTDMRKVMADVRHHVQEEENEPGLLPLLQAQLTAEELDELGEKLERLADMTPTRAHPLAPDRPPANKIAGLAATALDRARDALSGRGRP